MKILFWMFTGFDRHVTSEHLLSAVIEQLCADGHSVHILQKDTGGDLPAIPKTLSGYPVTTDAIPFQAAGKGNFVGRYLAELRYIRACKKHIWAGYDAVFLQSNNVAGFAVKAVRRRLPRAILTFNVQDIFPYNAAFSGSIRRGGVLFRALAAVQRYAYRHADHVVTISEDMRDTLVADGTDAEKIAVVYNWSYQDAPYENLDLAPVAHLFPRDRFHVVYAGNLGVMQNVELLIETAREMRDDADVQFHIIGDGVYGQKLRAKAEAYGLANVVFLPMQPPELAPLIYSAADVNVIPLRRDIFRTALPSKTATCLACGRPIIFAIGTESRFARTAAEAAGCRVTEPDRPEQLAEAIRAVRSEGRVAGDCAFFQSHFSRSANSRAYAGIITCGISGTQ